jgi:hypothetical protein
MDQGPYNSNIDAVGSIGVDVAVNDDMVDVRAPFGRVKADGLGEELGSAGD